MKLIISLRPWCRRRSSGYLLDELRAAEHLQLLWNFLVTLRGEQQTCFHALDPGIWASVEFPLNPDDRAAVLSYPGSSLGFSPPRPFTYRQGAKRSDVQS